jgi:oxygen-independent coproporphyrinogen-3 oxidase
MRHHLRPTIFIGGGTPSMLSLPQLERILRAAGAVVPLHAAEISLEANPGTLLGDAAHGTATGQQPGSDPLAYFRGLRALGINRLSLGVQSLHEPALRLLGRIHTAAEARHCFDAARRAGFASINLDVIFALPRQNVAQWRAMLDQLIAWGADHLSLYQLILEQPTPLAAQVAQGVVHLPDDESSATMYEAAMERLAAAGYTHYEISNWARDGAGQPAALPRHACHHNAAYWLNSDYMAAGAGAHGHCYPQRYANLPTIEGYIAAVARGEHPRAEVLDLTLHDLQAETMFMGLRLSGGVSYAHFRERCHAEMEALYGATLDTLVHQGLVERGTIGVCLTPRGRMLGNQVFAHFVERHAEQAESIAT